RKALALGIPANAEAALKELQDAPFDDKGKEKFREQAIAAWLTKLGEPNQANASSLGEELPQLKKYAPKAATVKPTRTVALSLPIPARATEVSNAGQFEQALDFLDKLDTTGQPGVVQEKKTLAENSVLSAWVAVAREHRKNKDFSQANSVLAEIRARRREY